MKSLFYEALSQYRNRWKGALVSSIGVIIATSAMVVINHVSAMIEQSIIDELTINGGLSMSLTLIDHAGAIDLDDVQSALSSIEHVKSVHPIGHTELTYDNTELSYIAVDQLHLISGYDVIKGRDLHPNDTLPYAVMTQKMQDNLASQGIYISVGDTLITNKGVLKIIGVISDILLPQGVPQAPNGLLISSLNTYQSILSSPPSLIIMNIQSLDFANEIGFIAKSKLIQIDPDLFVHVHNPSTIIDISNSMSTAASVFAYIAVTICSILGGIGIMNMNIADINQRKSEIALRVAFGATQKCIRRMLFIESCILCVASSIVGSILGLVISGVIANFNESFSFIFLPSSLITSALFAIGVGGFSTLYPAHLVQKIPVAYLLKGE